MLTAEYRAVSQSMAGLRLQLLLLATILALAIGTCHSFEFQEATLDAIHQGFKNGSLTSTALVQFYLGQIRRLNPLLRAVIEANPDAIRQAAEADAERRSSSADGHVGGLHGVPVLLKDNIATRDQLNTTAGSLAMLGSVVRRDAGVVARLRRAGAVVLGKANMDEWANFRSAIGTGGWSARGGQGKNPYVLSSPPCGSSTGPAIAAAANMAAVTLGTETDGSILCPASLNSVVGIKPTVGLTSRAGVIPISPTVGGSLWVEHRLSDCGGGEPCGGDARDRDRRLHTLPGVAQLSGRDQTHGRVDQPGWCDPHFSEARHNWANMPHGI